jgi:hypothetical protein
VLDSVQHFTHDLHRFTILPNITNNLGSSVFCKIQDGVSLKLKKECSAPQHLYFMIMPIYLDSWGPHPSKELEQQPGQQAGLNMALGLTNCLSKFLIKKPLIKSGRGLEVHVGPKQFMSVQVGSQLFNHS